MSKELKALEELEKVIDEITIGNADLRNTLKTSALIASIKQALLKAQELKDENRILLEDISDLEDQNVLYSEDLYNCEEVLRIIKKKRVDIFFLQCCETLEKYNLNIIKNCSFTYGLTQEEFELLKRYFE